MTSRAIKLTIRSRLDDLALMRAGLEGICGLTEMSDRETYNVVLCAVEAITNSIRHAYGGEDHHRVQLHVQLFADRIRLEVLDQGSPVPVERREPRPPADDDDLDALVHEGGRGIFLIHSLMDEVEFLDTGDGNVLAMTYRYRAATGG